MLSRPERGRMLHPRGTWAAKACEVRLTFLSRPWRCACFRGPAFPAVLFASPGRESMAPGAPPIRSRNTGHTRLRIGPRVHDRSVILFRHHDATVQVVYDFQKEQPAR